ncbi:MAG TPA: dockerin type 1 [Ruminococcus sp.]|nr:dockerin type 1 [Ruminococcus sp.]
MRKMMRTTMSMLCMAMAISTFLTGCSNTIETGSSDTREIPVEAPNSETIEMTTSETSETDSNSETSPITESATSVNVVNLNAPYTINTSGIFTERDLRTDYTINTTIALDGDSAEIQGNGATVDGSVITITEEGVYAVSGTLTDGQIVVNADGAKVQIVFMNADITCSSAPAVYVENAKKVFLTLADGSTNTISDGADYADQTDGAPDATIYSKDSLTINGTGSLTVNGNYNEGITSKDDLVIAGGNITVNSVGNAVKGKDYIAIADGNITINAGGDGLKATNATDEGMGFVYIQGGTLNITAEEDGIQAETEFVAEGGNVTVNSGGGTANAQPHMGDMMGGFGGGGMGGFGRGGWSQAETQNGTQPTPPDGQTPPEWNQDGTQHAPADGMPEAQTENTAHVANGGNIVNLVETNIDTNSADTSTEDTTISTKGIKAGTILYIGSGSFDVNTADDALHSNGDLYIAGGEISLSAGSKGIHADAKAEISSGTVNITESYEGIEAKDILVSGGTVNVVSSDDGFNASDGSDEGARGNAVSCSLTISGGNVYVNAGGDGLDSNGDLLVSGGIVIVDGPTNSGNGSLDSNSSLQCTGGLLVAVGASGMAEYPEGTQETIVMTTASSHEGGTLVTICDADGNEIFSYEPSKSWNSFIVSSSVLESGQTYTAYIGGTSTADNENGLYEPSGYQNDGTEEGSVTIESTVGFIGESGNMMGGGFGGDMGHGNFNPDDMQFPTDENGETVNPFENGGMGRGMKGDFNPDDMQLPTDENGETVNPFENGGHKGNRSGSESFRPENQETQQG